MNFGKKLIPALTHPFIMPFYAFSVFFGIEHSAYYYTTFQCLTIYASALGMSLGIPLWTMLVTKKKDVFNFETPVDLSSYYIFVSQAGGCILAYLIMHDTVFQTGTSANLLLPLFLIVTGIYAACAKKKLFNANGLFCGALSGYIITLDTRLNVDMMMPFIFSVIIFSLIAYLNIENHQCGYVKSLISYLTGIVAGCLMILLP